MSFNRVFVLPIVQVCCLCILLLGKNGGVVTGQNMTTSQQPMYPNPKVTAMNYTHNGTELIGYYSMPDTTTSTGPFPAVVIIPYVFTFSFLFYCHCLLASLFQLSLIITLFLNTNLYFSFFFVE
jgi:hypothetical protein